MQARDALLAALRDRAFDVLVIGGGITGCGIARDAALRGLSVALVEKDDFASGTSSRSSRLVHGGVRYLEHGHLHLVFESSAERRRLLRLAPHLVRPLRFIWPVYQGARISRWKLGAGLLLYDMLALFRNVGRHRRLSARDVLVNEPMLRAEGLRGGAAYFDAATNDARLTVTNAIAAQDAGAVVLNHARVIDLLREGGHVRGAVVREEFSSVEIAVHASVVVNATGPWSDAIRRLDEPAATTPAVRGSKGVHIAVGSDAIANRGAVTLLSPRDGRVFFVLPSDHTTIVGTTDTFTSAMPDEVRATEEDIDYLLDSANAFFPGAKLTRGHVIRAWAGIRPLLPTPSAKPGAATREHAITTSAQGLVSITGGKLTTYRVMAAQVVDTVAELLRRKTRGGVSARTVLPGGDFSSFDQLVGEVARATNDVDLAAHLATSYGSRWRAVWQEISNDGSERLVDGLPYTIGEMRYCVRNEMACTLGDLLIRRTHLAFEVGDVELLRAAEMAARSIAPVLGWSATEERRALEDFVCEVRRIFDVESDRSASKNFTQGKVLK